MSGSDNDDDADSEAVHARFARSVRGGGRPIRPGVKGASNPVESAVVEMADLIGAIHDGGALEAGGQLNDLRRQMTTTAKRNAVLPAPLHRQQRQRVERSVAYDSTRKEVSKWNNIVKQNRLAEQLVFPLNQIPFRLKTVAENADTFVPSTPLEIETAKLLQGSKYNLTNEKLYSAAEMEIIKSMSLREAREKCKEIQRMRSLMSYQEAKCRRIRKIKSKSYHRMLKRQERKVKTKEFQQLLTTDPEAAREKLEQLEKDRVMERATLKHRSTGKWAKQLQMHARNDDAVKAALHEQHRLGRRLTEKTQAAESSSEDDEEDRRPADNDADTLERLADSVDTNTEETTPFGLAEASNPWLRSKLVEIRRRNKPTPAPSNANADIDDGPPQHLTVAETDPQLKSSVKKQEKKKKGNKTEAEEETSLAHPATRSRAAKRCDTLQVKPSAAEADVTTAKKRVKRKERAADVDAKGDVKEGSEKRRKRKEPDVDLSSVDIDSLFQATEDKLVSASIASQEGSTPTEFVKVKRKKKSKQQDNATPSAIPNGLESRKTPSSTKIAKKKASVEPEPATTLDPTLFLKADGKPMMQVSSELVQIMDDEAAAVGAEERARATMSEAFADDDVIDAFSAEKAHVAARDMPKDVDLTLPGWGAWAGPDTRKPGRRDTKKKQKRFVIKAPEAPPRKDQFLPGVIISTKDDPSIRKLQVSSLPFPYTSVEDFETVIRHPIGRDWNPDSAHRSLTEPAVVTKRGAAIMPMNKQMVFKQRQTELVQSDSDDEGV